MVRRISWIKVALGAFQAFPAAVQEPMTTVLAQSSRGEKADKAKPMKGLGTGVFEIVMAYRGQAIRAAYADQLAEDDWVVHALQQKRPRASRRRRAKST